MTIAIAAYGPNAGHAVAQGVAAAEILGRGAIGGFAVFSVLDDAGEHRQICCQNGGIAGLDNCAAYRSARCAAVISSGPDRPEPLSQFLAGRAHLGLVTGHRLPNKVGANGRPLNQAALELMAEGRDPSEAVRSVLEVNPECDAGLIAVRPGGPLAAGNSARVDRRNDALMIERQERDRGYALLCNSIYTAREVALEKVAGAIIWGCLSGERAAFLIAELTGSVPLRLATRDRIELDSNNQVRRIDCAEPNAGKAAARLTVIHAGAEVWQDGQYIGKAISEVFAAVTDGQAVTESQFIVERA